MGNLERTHPRYIWEYTDKNYNNRILKDIQNINFPNLLELTLRQNNIESI